MTILAIAPLLAVGGSADSVGSWAVALRVGVVLVVAVAVVVPLVGMLARAVDAAEINHLEGPLEAHEDSDHQLEG